jgi:phosphoribosylanthranilate isomerase
MKTRIKICGITCVEDAVAVAEMGADEIGLNFYSKSPRSISLETAGDICSALPSGITKVGVFVNADVDTVLEYAAFLSLDAIQLHGDETKDFIRTIRCGTDKFLIKAIPGERCGNLDELLSIPVDALLIDSPHAGEYGGTGEPFDWGAASMITGESSRIYVAGGLSSANVAVALRLFRPYAVDACSRLEGANGRKDHSKVEAFIREVRRAI